jgi:hypothetical protein
LAKHARREHRCPHAWGRALTTVHVHTDSQAAFLACLFTFCSRRLLLLNRRYRLKPQFQWWQITPNLIACIKLTDRGTETARRMRRGGFLQSTGEGLSAGQDVGLRPEIWCDCTGGEAAADAQTKIRKGRSNMC